MIRILLPYGRMRRTLFGPLAFVLGFLGLLVAAALNQAVLSDNPNLKFAVLPFILLLAWPKTMIGLQRAHDIGSSVIVRGWICFVFLNGLALTGLMMQGSALQRQLMPEQSERVIVTEFGQEIVVTPATPESGVPESLEMFGYGLIILSIGIFALAILCLLAMLVFAPGENDTNEYGEDPRRAAAAR